MFTKDLVKGLTIYATLFLVVGPVMWLSDSIAPAYYMGPIVAVVLFLLLKKIRPALFAEYRTGEIKYMIPVWIFLITCVGLIGYSVCFF